MLQLRPEPISEAEMRERYRGARLRTFGRCEPRPKPQIVPKRLARPVPPKPVVPKRGGWPMAPLPQVVWLATVSMVWAEFAEWLLTAQPTQRLVAEIIQEAAERYQATEAEIKGHSRQRRLCAIRQSTMARAYVERPELSLVQLGRQFGGRDHTTVFHAVRKAGVWRNPRFIPFAKKDAA